LNFFFLRPLLKFKINDILVNWNEQFITGLQIRNLGNISSDAKVYLKIKGKFDDDIITDNEKVDLARPGIEKFYSKPNFEVVTVTIDEKLFEIKKGEYSGSDLKKIGKVPLGYELEQIKDGIHTVEDNDIVNISGGEVFISHPKDGQSS
jgi:hypothetical protein